MSNKPKVFHGKHGAYQNAGFFGQQGGSVPKIRREVYRTKEERRQMEEKISFIEKIEGSSGECIKEKILLDFYSTLSRTPECRIALQKGDHCKDLLNLYFTHGGNPLEVTRELSEAFYQGLPTYGTSMDDKYHVTFMGKMLSNYSDLGVDFVRFIETHHRPPESIVKDRQEYPLDGLMEIAAIAKVLDDPDWLGGSGGNTGFVIERDESGHTRAVAILVDAGMGLSDTPKRQSPESKNIQVGNALPTTFDIHFNCLTESQKLKFIGTLYKFVNCENLESLLEFIVKREGAFNSQKDKYGNTIALWNDADADQMINRIQNNIERLSHTYREELEHYRRLTNQPGEVPITDFNIVIPEPEAEQAAAPEPEAEQAAAPEPEAKQAAAPEPAARQGHSKAPANNSSWWPMLKTGAAALTLGATIAAVAYIGSKTWRSNNI
ncbi:hypothetical protein EP47_07180 [Legionella norrlandica]|uniref:Uncharacterized protein n=1 Tax=Legionella norrlandica TaxID=1498499 RepID=A0A0A2SWY8_9GAMM|nr:hypothetical protein [Legionella norrlandica]KGP63909.1 hypothetical protein EP47_07180 [Legionella norrlandica]